MPFVGIGGSTTGGNVLVRARAAERRTTLTPMGILSRLFGGTSKSSTQPASSAPLNATRLGGIQMHPQPWTLSSLPVGPTQRDFEDAALALGSQQLIGRVIPVPAAMNRPRGLSGTHYTHNASRIERAFGYPPLAVPHVALGPASGLIVPGIFWLDSSEADETRPVACIGPNGYYGSLYAGDLSRELHNFVRYEAQRDRLVAVALELNRAAHGAPQVSAWLPKVDEIERLRRWLKTPEAVVGAGFVPRIEIKAWLKRLGDYQEELESLLAGAEQTEARVRLSLEETEAGKYRGERFIRATVLDRTIGLVPAQYRKDEPHLFAAVESGTTTARARIFRYPERIGVQIVLD